MMLGFCEHGNDSACSVRCEGSSDWPSSHMQSLEPCLAALVTSSQTEGTMKCFKRFGTSQHTM